MRFFAAGLLVLGATAQDPVSWKLDREGTGAMTPGAKVVLVATARIQDGWALYSVTQRPGGPIPTRISIPARQVVEADGDIVCDPPLRKHDPNFDMEVEYHAGAVTCRLPARIAAGAAGQHKVRVEARYQVCNDQICLPPKTADMETTVTVGRDAVVRAAQWMPPCACDSEAWKASVEGADFHRTRRLDEASAAYARALKLAPARDPSAAEREAILRFAPGVLAHPRDPFPLRDAAAVMHPKLPWIAYHFFWEDDIDFPDDNDPCDHELMWVELDEARAKVVSYYTYFHGRLLKGEPRDGIVTVVVQWGKHGTMPLDWRGIHVVADSGDVEASHIKLMNQGIPLEVYNRATWVKLSTVGRQSQESPLARGWPLKFTGDWEDFIDFSKPVDIAARLKEKNMMRVGWFSNAVINRHFLRYNFSAKTEWPPAVCR